MGRVTARRPYWSMWHARYDMEGHPVQRRLATVQRAIRDFLDRRAGEDLVVISVCSGEGRDILGALADYPGRAAVRGRLIDIEPANTEVARARAAEIGLHRLEVVTGDASVTTAYEGAVPADLVLVCGVLGCLSNDDIENTVELLPQLCAADATVIWTRHRRKPDQTPEIRRWFRDGGFEEQSFESGVPGSRFFWSVGVFNFRGKPQQLQHGLRLFTFGSAVQDTAAKKV